MPIITRVTAHSAETYLTDARIGRLHTAMLTGHADGDADGDTMTLHHYWTMNNDDPAHQDGRYGQVYSEGAFMVEFGGFAGNGQA